MNEHMYRELDPDKTLKTIDTLQSRITERFPESGLSKVCQELREVASESKQEGEWIRKPHVPLRLMIGFVVVAGIGGMVFTFTRIDFSVGSLQISDFATFVEAIVNDLLLIGAGLFFLTTIETRIKRKRALDNLHDLRALAHVIDMHQLTKDPSRIINKKRPMTPSSPKPFMTLYEVTRYLDYCSEMLSLTGKIAALYAQYLPDEIVLNTVNDIETLSTGLSRKIWQKIVILQQMELEAQNEN